MKDFEGNSSQPWKDYKDQIKSAYVSNMKNIGAFTFSGCKNMASVTIKEGITKIGRGCFISCTSLSSISIPSSVQIIERGAFVYFAPSDPLARYFRPMLSGIETNGLGM